MRLVDSCRLGADSAIVDSQSNGDGHRLLASVLEIQATRDDVRPERAPTARENQWERGEHCPARPLYKQTTARTGQKGAGESAAQAITERPSRGAVWAAYATATTATNATA